MALYNNILETIGKTPLVRLSKIEDYFNVNNKLFAKLESFNPSNNVKVRPAFYMIKKMYEKEIITKDHTIIEATSGNTGIGLAMVGAYYGNRTIIIMPESVSKERIAVLKHYGAEVILTPQDLGIVGSQDKAKELMKEIKDAVIPSQFSNKNNPLSHYETTAKEIEEDLNQEIDYIFITAGTGGTISGIGKYFKEKKSFTKIIAIEPKNSPVLSGGKPNKHKIQGIGPSFIPKIFDYKVVDEIILADDDKSWNMTKLIPRIEGISCGISSGAALSSALDYLKHNNIINKSVVIIFPDSGEKYFSTGVYE
jgi:cysteine synthase